MGILVKVCHHIRVKCTKYETRPQGYKTFFMLNSAEHEIYPANKCLNVGILTFISMINTTFEGLKARNFVICR